MLEHGEADEKKKADMDLMYLHMDLDAKLSNWIKDMENTLSSSIAVISASSSSFLSLGIVEDDAEDVIVMLDAFLAELFAVWSTVFISEILKVDFYRLNVGLL